MPVKVSIHPEKSVSVEVYAETIWPAQLVLPDFGHVSAITKCSCYIRTLHGIFHPVWEKQPPKSTKVIKLSIVVHSHKYTKQVDINTCTHIKEEWESITPSVDERRLILVYPSLTWGPTSRLGTWVVGQTECPGRSRWSRGSWRPNPRLTLPQSAPSSLSELWVLQHYNSQLLVFVMRSISCIKRFSLKESHFLHTCMSRITGRSKEQESCR